MNFATLETPPELSWQGQELNEDEVYGADVAGRQYLEAPRRRRSSHTARLEPSQKLMIFLSQYCEDASNTEEGADGRVDDI